MDTLEQTIHALLVDDHAIFRQGVAGALAEPNVTVDHCGTIAEALQIHFPAPDRSGAARSRTSARNARPTFCRPPRQAGFEGRVLVVTAWITENEARRLMRQGVSGIFLKHAPLEELREAIRTTMAGGLFGPLLRSCRETGREPAGVSPPVQTTASAGSCGPCWRVSPIRDRLASPNIGKLRQSHSAEPLPKNRRPNPRSTGRVVFEQYESEL